MTLSYDGRAMMLLTCWTWQPFHIKYYRNTFRITTGLVLFGSSIVSISFNIQKAVLSITYSCTFIYLPFVCLSSRPKSISFFLGIPVYGFRRVKESVLMSTNTSKAGSNDTYQFMHEFFRKNQRHLLHRIRRKPQNSAIHNLTSSSSSSNHHHTQPNRRSNVAHEAMEKRLDLLHEQLRAVESKYTAMLNETQELHNLHSQQLKVIMKRHNGHSCNW